MRPCSGDVWAAIVAAPGLERHEFTRRGRSRHVQAAKTPQNALDQVTQRSDSRARTATSHRAPAGTALRCSVLPPSSVFDRASVSCFAAVALRSLEDELG